MNKPKIWTITFLCLILCPEIIWTFIVNNIDIKNYENRNRYEKPVLRYDKLMEYSEEYEKYYNDTAPFRNELVRLNSWLNYHVFHESSNDLVMIGKNDWLFYTAGKSPVKQALGNFLFSDEELKSIAYNLICAKKYLESRNIEFVLFIAPNKETIYYEEFPDYCYRISEETNTEQLIKYLHDNTDIRIVWPYNEMIKEKERLDIPIYCHLDTHWNNGGGYIGAKALAKELGINMPSLNIDDLTEWRASEGDLTRMLNLRLENVECDYNIANYDNLGVMCEQTAEKRIEYHNNFYDSKRVIIFRDSFGVRLGNYLSKWVNDLYLVTENPKQAVLNYNADVFVYEIVERNIDKIKLDFE